MDMKIGPFQFYQGIRLSGRLVIMKYSIGALPSSPPRLPKIKSFTH